MSGLARFGGTDRKTAEKLDAVVKEMVSRGCPAARCGPARCEAVCSTGQCRNKFQRY